MVVHRLFIRLTFFILLCCFSGQLFAQELRGVKTLNRNLGLGTTISRIVPTDTANFWLATNTSGNVLAHYKRGNWMVYSLAQFGLPTLNIRDLTSHDNRLWMATNQGVLVFSTNDSLAYLDTIYNVAGGFLSNDVRSIDGNGGRLSIATAAGLAVLEQGVWQNFTLANGDFITNNILRVRQNHRQLVAVTDSGIYVKEDQQSWRLYTMQLLREASATNIHAAPIAPGELIMTSQQQVLKLAGGTKVELTDDHYYGKLIGSRDFLVEEDQVWSMSTEGLIAVNGKRDAFAFPLSLTNNARLQKDRQGNYYTVGTTSVYIIDSLRFYSDFNSGVSAALLDIGNYRMYFSAKGDMFYDATTQKNIAEYPKRDSTSGQTQKNVAYAGHLWIGGLANSNQLHVSAQTYRISTQFGQNYWSGPLGPTGQVNEAIQRKFDRVWKINRYDIENFKWHFQNNLLSGSGYNIPADIMEWPGTRPGTTIPLAPFVDHNQDGRYDPMDGDYPDIKGDQMLWWVYNDVKPGRGLNNPAMGIEVATSVYGFTCPNAQNDSGAINTTFLMNKKITNWSGRNYSAAALGLWIDGDLGNGSDDYVACDIPLNMVYTYNGDDNDQGLAGYGNQMPAFGTMVLKGPRAPLNDGIDNNRNFVIDELEEDIRMTGHHYYDITPLSNGIPTTGEQVYLNLTGRWKDSSSVIYGGNGTAGSSGSTSLLSSMMFPGNSDADIGWGIGGTSANPIFPPFHWSELNPGPGASPNMPGDRRNILAMSGFNYQAGATEEITLAFLISRSTQPGAQASVTKLLTDANTVKNWYLSNQFPSCLDLSTVSVEEPKPGKNYKIYPNPVNAVLAIELDESVNSKAELYNLQGKLVLKTGIHAGKAQMNLQELRPGIYFIKWLDQGVVNFHKIIVAR